MTLSPQSEAMRRNMVDSQLRTGGVNTPWLVAAMLAVPREQFVPKELQATAYTDRSIPLGGGRMLNPPLATGQMLMIAEPKMADHVLLIGAGSGYMAALLAGQVGTLVAVDDDAILAQAARTHNPDLNLIEAPLAAGAPDHAPYDLIIIDGAIEAVPDAIVAQLAEGGRIVCGLVDGPVSRLASGIKHGAHLALRAVSDLEVAPLPGFAHPKEFVF